MQHFESILQQNDLFVKKFGCYNQCKFWRPEQYKRIKNSALFRRVLWISSAGAGRDAPGCLQISRKSPCSDCGRFGVMQPMVFSGFSLTDGFRRRVFRKRTCAAPAQAGDARLRPTRTASLRRPEYIHSHACPPGLRPKAGSCDALQSGRIHNPGIRCAENPGLQNHSLDPERGGSRHLGNPLKGIRSYGRALAECVRRLDALMREKSE